jgi:hypothetical protein
MIATAVVLRYHLRKKYEFKKSRRPVITVSLYPIKVIGTTVNGRQGPLLILVYVRVKKLVSNSRIKNSVQIASCPKQNKKFQARPKKLLFFKSYVTCIYVLIIVFPKFDPLTATGQNVKIYSP